MGILWNFKWFYHRSDQVNLRRINDKGKSRIMRCFRFGLEQHWAELDHTFSRSCSTKPVSSNVGEVGLSFSTIVAFQLLHTARLAQI